MHAVRLTIVAALSLVVAPAWIPAPAAATAAQRSDEALAQEVRRALSRVRDLRRVQVSVSGTEVTLSGQAPTLWLTQEAIRRAIAVGGVETVVSEIELPRARSDAGLAQQVGRAIDQHPQLTMFDYVTGHVQNGVVTLTGSVTADGRKADQAAEEVARVQGVQEIRNEIVTLPPSLEDDRIRVSIYTRLLSNIHLQALTISRPAFFVVVHNGVVSLYGQVPGEIEYRQFESLARETTGVLRVHNHLERSARRR